MPRREPDTRGERSSRALTLGLLLGGAALATNGHRTLAERRDVLAESVELAGCVARCGGEAAGGASPAAVVHELSTGRELPELLDAELEVVCPDEKIVRGRFADAIARGSVHVVNLWNPFCAPCLAEFPELAQVLAHEPPRPATRVRFVSVDVDDFSEPQVNFALASRRDEMPDPDERLVERDGREAVKQSVHSLGVRLRRPGDRATAPDSVPVTLVLDCQRRVRWIAFGRLSTADAEALGRVLDALSAEPCPRRGAAGSARLCGARRGPGRAGPEPKPPTPTAPPAARFESQATCVEACQGLCRGAADGPFVCDAAGPKIQ